MNHVIVLSSTKVIGPFASKWDARDWAFRKKLKNYNVTEVVNPLGAAVSGMVMSAYEEL